MDPQFVQPKMKKQFSFPASTNNSSFANFDYAMHIFRKIGYPINHVIEKKWDAKFNLYTVCGLETAHTWTRRSILVKKCKNSTIFTSR